VRVSGRLFANNGDILIDAALGGLGIALLPTFMAGEHVQAGRLVTLLSGFAAPEAALYAVYPPGRHLSAKLRSFIDFLAARFGEEPEWDRWCREESVRG
jgi:DNA-binding transcriptional LysR family regulator